MFFYNPPFQLFYAYLTLSNSYQTNGIIQYIKKQKKCKKKRSAYLLELCYYTLHFALL